MVVYPWLILSIAFIAIFLVIPVIIFLSLYVTALVMYVYRHRQKLDAKRLLSNQTKWKSLLYVIVMLWEAHGYFWHSYEVDGLDRIPNEGPALIVYYHGCIPLDHFYLMTKILLYKKRFVRSVGDHFLFMLPGSKTLMKELKVLTGPVDQCVKLLSEGDLLSIAPGGCREGLFGDNLYKLMWNNRSGFAKVAFEAKVPIIPVFTQNLREAFIAVKLFQCILKPLYEWTRLPVIPFYGGFPVKLKTFVGKPIPYDPKITPEELAQQTMNAVEELIRQNQRIPGNIWDAFCDRF
ncbi:unnamed protein product [Medioppia subpectinata]|uniref:Phospholipid/glycerol acyltransferase domain-containing protein n=1 Tax=Medioppia subpectinata TaxID=1979941 RepID=A0A7R9Q7M4_9ACAR|nr:unnamed protein product [Medioppia subpectinata]CAG2114958.1 unnamed protein product [Medioppia subpectinata]